MNKCEFFNTCVLFHSKMFLDSGLAAEFRLKYCECNKKNCARYKVCTQKGKDYVLDTLLPFMNDRATQIIAENS